MYFDFTVPIPELPGKIIKKRKGTSTYVLYEYDRTYNPQKKYAIPQRSIIGKVSDEQATEMYPNEKFQEYFPDYVFPEERSEAYRSCCLRIGTYLVIQKVLDEYDLPKLLEKWLKKDTGLFLDLVSYLIVDEDNAGQYYPDFAFCHPLFSEKMKIYSDVKVSRFLSSLTVNQTIGFLNDWNKKRDHRQRVYVSYDSTNKNCQAGDIDIVEFGKAKDDKGCPIFNLALAFDRTNRVPLFYEEYPGSINDVSQFTFMVDKVREYGYRNIGFILDRGYFSKENIRYMTEKRYAFIMMVKGCKSLVSSLIMEARGTFESKQSCSIRAYKVYGTTVHSKLYEDDQAIRYFHIYYNPGRHAAEREQLERKLDRYRDFLKKHEGEVIEFGKTYQQYFDLKYDSDGHFLYAREKDDVIGQELDLCGYFCIITSEKMTAEKALIHYKSRDMSEKLFQMDKSFIGSKSMRVQSSEAMSAKIFVEFITLIIRNRMYCLLKDEMLRISDTPNYMTVPAAVRELEKIEMIRRGSGSYGLDHAISRKQKTILAAFGIDQDNVRAKAAEISHLLTKGESLIETEKQEGEEDGTKEVSGID